MLDIFNINKTVEIKNRSMMIVFNFEKNSVFVDN